MLNNLLEEKSCGNGALNKPGDSEMGFQVGAEEGQAQRAAPGRLVPQESLERGGGQQSEQRHFI